MSFIPWLVPVKADSNRANDLKELASNRNALTLIFVEEETEDTWKLTFDSVQAFRTTTEECASEVLKNIPTDGGFYKAEESVWLKELGKGRIPFLENAEHFIICCYDEVVEVIAQAETSKFTKVD